MEEYPSIFEKAHVEKVWQCHDGGVWCLGDSFETYCGTSDGCHEGGLWFLAYSFETYYGTSDWFHAYSSCEYWRVPKQVCCWKILLEIWNWLWSDSCFSC